MVEWNSNGLFNMVFSVRSRPPLDNLDLFSATRHPAGRADREWPDASRFPLNLPGRRVQETVFPDLRDSGFSLLVAGYASLDRIVDYVASVPPEQTIRIVFGTEPFPGRRESYRMLRESVGREMEDYWLERGISLRLSAGVIHCIKQIRAGRLEARYMGGTTLHAKIYCGEHAATTGSSNFTEPGMARQLECNARFSRTKDAARYRELRDIAENFWSMAEDYTQDLAALLEQLLRTVVWQEALARSCSELLEGEWANKVLRDLQFPGDPSLWPTQKQGIAQALYILSRQGSVLVADAAGSGKTRTGVYLVGSLFSAMLREGRMRRERAVMICPPAVKENWEHETSEAGVAMEAFSHGVLSSTRSRDMQRLEDELRRTQILCVDEGHNFLNKGSGRTQRILRNMADHVLLFTATPINKGVSDLLRIVDLLGADNLDPDTLNHFRQMFYNRTDDQAITAEEAQMLRREIQKFTVRRTKPMLKRLIEQEPEAYRDRFGRPCRFPRHESRTYSLQESRSDRDLATDIRGLAKDLLGVSYIRKAIEMPKRLHGDYSPEEYLKGRLALARTAAWHHVTSSLRSSRPALAEHIIGAEEASRLFSGLGDYVANKQVREDEYAGRLSTLDAMAGVPPGCLIPGVRPPEWIVDPDAHAEACRHDAEIYRQILVRLQAMSDGRERTKARRIIKLLDRHALILAFDHRPITLFYLKQLLTDMACPAEIVVATGSYKTGQRRIVEAFGLGSDTERMVGLCSDSLAEGVNLQKASAFVHLDMPSVLRYAEQRVGRIDRLDSPHEKVEVWWPRDAEEFALTSDKRFLHRYETVEALLGSNMPLPRDMVSPDQASAVDTDAYLEELSRWRKTDGWEGIRDAFAPVRELVEGESALVDRQTYAHYRKTCGRVLSRVSVVRTGNPWAFFCMSAGDFGAPRWVFLSGDESRPPITDLEKIAEALRTELQSMPDSGALDETATHFLHRCLDRLSGIERLLLPRRKQSALEEMRWFLERFKPPAGDPDAAELAHGLLSLLVPVAPKQIPDWDEMASSWLEIVRPYWYEVLRSRRKGPLRLKDIRKTLADNQTSIWRELKNRFVRIPGLPDPETRIVACILGLA